MTMDDLVMVNILCTDLSLFKNFNTVYRTYFHNGFPRARSPALAPSYSARTLKSPASR